MNDALLVRGLQRFGDLLRDGDRFIDRDCTIVDPIGEGWPFHELHHQSRDSPAALESIDRRNVGMVQRGQHFGLALEPGEAVGILRDRFRQDLDGDGPLQAGVGGAIHLAHAAFAEEADDFMGSQTGTGRERHAPTLCGQCAGNQMTRQPPRAAGAQARHSW